MNKIEFTDKNGTFRIHNPENYSGLYLPLAGETGLKSSITPNLGGDSKTDQNHFLLEPVSIENLHNNRNTRNFWCRIENKGSWSVCGSSAKQEAAKFTKDQDESILEAGFMWQKLTRISREYEMKAETTSFVTIDGTMEVMMTELTNTADQEQKITPVAVIPLYGRSADNIRDHRHVTSLLHRIETKRMAWRCARCFPLMRGPSEKSDGLFCIWIYRRGRGAGKILSDNGNVYRGRGSYLNPEAVRMDKDGVLAGTKLQGKEAAGGMRFAPVTLKPQETVTYLVICRGFRGKTEH